MNKDTINQLLAGLSKPVRRFRKMTARISEAEFVALQANAAARYENYSDVVRAALAAYLRKD